MARDFFYRTLNPENPTGELIDVCFPGDLTERWYKYQPVQYENLRAAAEVLSNVRRIFGGIREYQEGGWCYTGRPRQWCVQEGVWAPFPQNRVFAVYLNPRLRVFACTAERIASDDPLNPEGWKGRYEGLLWKSTS